MSKKRKLPAKEFVQWIEAVKIRVWIELKRGKFTIAYQVPPAVEPAFHAISRQFETDRDELATFLWWSGRHANSFPGGLGVA